ncbi:prolyl oligopeptidase family serine peptidase [uncultured Phenylobacterium sp.]|uniref:alpha/beta hydrolase family protein n=1 Tax=uncultured Phenylobacterium sp. TaxID=349273 RepID=UPI0025F88863|nr:prolyl oligopeptidase family serine peptidase [uncultured Phenylobacterium sp.]
MKRASVSALAALALLAGVPHAPASARPFTIEDLLSQGSFGAQALDPSGRWFAFEQRGPYNRFGRYDTAVLPSRAAGRLQVVDLDRREGARPLLADDAGPGVSLGAFSPSGTRLAVYQLVGRTWRLGVVTMANGAVRWFSAAPRTGGQGRALQWLSDTDLLVLDRSDGSAPPAYRTAWVADERLPAAWEAAARGGTAHTVYGSGAYAGVRAKAPLTALLRLNAETGAVVELARGPFRDLELSPDLARVALFSQGPDIQPRPDGPVRGVAGSETEETRLQILDLRTRRIVDTSATCDFLPQVLSWSPKGDALLAFARATGQAWPDGQLLRVRASDGAAARIGEGLSPAIDTNPVVVRSAWMGQDPVLWAYSSVGGGRADWFRLGAKGPVNLTARLAAPGKAILASGATGLVLLSEKQPWRVDREGRATRLSDKAMSVLLTSNRGIDGVRLSRAAAAATWLAATENATTAQLVRATSGGLKPLRTLTNLYGPIVGISDRTGDVLVRQTGRKGVEAFVRLDRDGTLEPLATINRSLSETDALKAEPIHHLGLQGEALTSWLFVPPRATGSPPPPLIVRPYVGYAFPSVPQDGYLEEGFLQNLRMLVGHGYAVLVPSLPTPPGGQTEPMERLAERILAAEAAARVAPGLAGAFDPERVAILGWSFGGYTTMATITQTDRFRAAVAIDGVSDLTAYWSRLSLVRQLLPEEGYLSNWSTGTVEATQPELGGPPWRERDRYLRNSPLWFADQIHTPLLLIHGWRDPLSVAQSEAMYSALFRQDKDAMLVVYWGAGHQPTSPGDVADVWARTFAFLDEHLPFTPAAVARTRANPAPGSANVVPTPP